MEFSLRNVTVEDYDNILTTWWESWGWNPPPVDMLPQTGLIVSNVEGVDICAGFLYRTDSKATWLEYIVSNKDYTLPNRKKAIELLINCLSEIAREEGYKYIYTSLKSDSLINKYSNCGFMKGDSNCQEMIKII